MSAPLSTREKNLSFLVGAIFLLGLTYLVGDYFLKNHARLRADLANQKKQLATLESLSGEKALWEKREAWLREKQPKLVDDDSGGVKLLDQIKELAKTKQVVLEKPVIRPPLRKPDYTAITVEIETKSTWPALIGFLSQLQSPEQFIVLESANLKIDGADQTQMRGRFKIARWFAPK
ncbi:MAG: hypothetical protein K8R23_00245 [Chthoniobacter sp.]|nr:hypothetical protein [Chthoniobacter sp.]